ncbi:MAG: undecaprenyl-diphosphate phosphatase [Candidatus Moranbacteria bacterium]|nr:undecaprenyl-diphosphate phosphatase [Candidatus Moranbacteria bacterium]
MSILHSIILGIVEGLTEFLPVSSTGHLILVSDVLGVTQTDFVKSFEIVIQLGAILAVVVLYWRRFLTDWETLKRLAVAFLPTAFVGLVLYRFIKKLFESPMTIVVTLFLGGLVILFFEWWLKSRESDISELATDEISYKQALLIGVAQSTSVIPGVSRSGATIIGGLALGLSRTAITEFSFLLAVPTMAAATGYDFLKSAGSFSSADLPALAIGFFVSFVVALFAVKSFIRFVKTNSFNVFGMYRIVAALAFYFLVIR